MARMELAESQGFALQTLSCELGLLSRSVGSAMFRQGDTICLAAVHGPTEAKPQRVLIDKANVEVYYRRKVGLPGVTDRFRESLLGNTCEIALMATLYPRMSILIVIQEVQSCGESISCAVNAACLALLDSGIEMKFLVAAANCILDAEGRVIVDPPHLEYERAQTKFAFVFDSVRHNVVASNTSGKFSDHQYHEALLKCKSAVQVVFEFYRRTITHRQTKI